MRLASLTNTPLDATLGSGKTVLAWSEGLRRLGHEVDVFSPELYYRPWRGRRGHRLKMRLDPLRLEDQLLGSGLELVEFYGAEFGPLIQRLARRPRKERPLLVAHTNGLELLADAAGARAPAGLDGHPHWERWMTCLVEGWFRRSDRFSFAAVDAFAAICQADAEFLIGEKLQPEERCAVVEPGIDQAFLNAPWQRFKQPWLVALGSWTERKDPQTLMQVAARVLEADPSVSFHVIGAGGAIHLILQSLPSHLHPRSVIHPRLSQAEMVEILSQSKVFVFPSLYEGYGMATAEAMACGCAAVVTPTGLGAALEHEKEAWVCPFGDVNKMADAVLYLLRNDGVRQALTLAGRRRVEGQTWDRQVSSLAGVYEGWMEKF